MEGGKFRAARTPLDRSNIHTHEPEARFRLWAHHENIHGHQSSIDGLFVSMASFILFNFEIIDLNFFSFK